MLREEIQRTRIESMTGCWQPRIAELSVPGWINTTAAPLPTCIPGRETGAANVDEAIGCRSLR